MNSTTIKIKQKGYSLKEFCLHVGFSLRTYRRYEKPDSKYNNMLNSIIADLKSKRQ